MGCSVGFKYAKNALAARAPDPTGGAHDAPSDLSRFGRGTPIPMPHPLGGTSILVPNSNLVPPALPSWKPGAPSPADLQLAKFL